MPTGKRISKRSILGTRVMAPGQDGRYYPGHIHAVKSNDDTLSEKSYIIQYEDSKRLFEFSEKIIVGHGFKSVSDVTLLEGQKVFITINNREISGTVVRHDFEAGEVLIKVQNVNNHEEVDTVLASIDEVRLLESRKSARLINFDTDFSKLADVNISLEKKKPKSFSSSIAIQVPTSSDYIQITGSRKRRTSENLPDDDEEVLTECSAAMLLMKLSCSPHSPSMPINSCGSSYSMSNLPSPAGSSSGASSFRSSTPSPPLSMSVTDEGIVKDLIFAKKATQTIYQCTFPGCRDQHITLSSIEQHVRRQHLNKPDSEEGIHNIDIDDGEEEFYFTEIEVPAVEVEAALKRQGGGERLSPSQMLVPSLGLSDHLDMARPAHEDPGQRKRNQSMTSALHKRQNNNNNNISGFSHSQESLLSTSLPNQPLSFPSMRSSSNKLILISPPARGMSVAISPHVGGGKSPVKRVRDGKKCRKVYGLEQRDLWCTQCKWKKACARFGSNANEILPPSYVNGQSIQTQLQIPQLFTAPVKGVTSLKF